jgi:hypothetical protein
MRSDMGRVVIERPRGGSSNKSPKVRHFPGRIDHDNDYDGPTRLPSSVTGFYGFAPTIGEKGFTDVLGPLRRYLHRNVGRPWNKVYGEAKSVLKAGGWGVQHVFDAHFLGEVERDAYRDERGALMARRYGMSFPVSGFYVNPRTGLLCHADRVPRKRQPRQADTDRIPLGDGRWYVPIGDLWFIARYEDFSGMAPSEQMALTRKGDLRRWPNIEGDRGKLRICRVEKSCNKKDLREIGRILAER